MIIVCPQCAKEYRVDPAELPPAKTSQYKNAGKGWWLSCRFCFKEWWYKAPKGFSWYEGGATPPEQYAKTVARKPGKYVDKTDLSGLNKHTQNYTHEEEVAHHERIMQQEYNPFEGYNGAQMESIELQTPRNKLSTKIFASTLGVMILIILGAFLKPIWVEDTSEIIQKTVALKPPKAQNILLALQISNVRYDIVDKLDKRIVTLMGAVHNTHDKSVKLPPLKISIWGPCRPDSLGRKLETPEGKPHCLIKDIDYDLNKILKSNETFEFSTSHKVLLDATIEKVHIKFDDEPFKDQDEDENRDKVSESVKLQEKNDSGHSSGSGGSGSSGGSSGSGARDVQKTFETKKPSTKKRSTKKINANKKRKKSQK